jgi:uncharacterized iron-regulated protein
VIPQSALALAALVAAAPAVAGADEIDATGLYDLPAAEVYVLGEVHDNPVHHAHQSIAIGALAPKAVVYEMLSVDQAGHVTPRLLSSEAALGAVLGWEGSGWPDFAMYYPVFVAGAGAAVMGAAAPRDDVRRATDEGAAAVFGDGADRYGIDAPLPPPEQLLREAGQLTAHCDALPTGLLPGMVEAQRLRDAWLARATLDALAEHGPPVAVVTGNGHARADWGVPRMIAAADPDVRVFALGQFEDEAWPDPPFDAWIVTDAAPRPDPCEAFR